MEDFESRYYANDLSMLCGIGLTAMIFRCKIVRYGCNLGTTTHASQNGIPNAAAFSKRRSSMLWQHWELTTDLAKVQATAVGPDFLLALGIVVMLAPGLKQVKRAA